MGAECRITLGILTKKQTLNSDRLLQSELREPKQAQDPVPNALRNSLFSGRTPREELVYRQDPGNS